MLEVNGISKSYGELSVIKDFSLKLTDGEAVAITGPSGCGKTTLLNIIAGLEKQDEGTVNSFGGKISYMFQDTRLLPWRDVHDNIKLVNDDASEDEIASVIEEVGLKGFEHFYPNELSGGMKRRAALARALVYNADTLLMDEPFQGLDYGIRMDILNMLHSLWIKRRNTILFVTHEMDEALTLAGRIIVVSKRPCTVVREFILPSSKERDIESKEMLGIRRECIRMIMGGDKE